MAGHLEKTADDKRGKKKKKEKEKEETHQYLPEKEDF